MDIAIVHNFAEHPGGGDLVALDIIETLIDHGDNVWLYTSRRQGLDMAIKYFSKNENLIENVQIEKIHVPGAVRHPYNTYLITRRTLNDLKQFDLVIFFDDIPKPAIELKRILVYAHYPHATRVLLNQLIPYRYLNDIRGRLLWKAHSLLFRRCFLMNWNKPNIFAAVNSTLTYDHVSKALRPMCITKIYPPVQVEQVVRYVEWIDENKGDLCVYIGRIQPEKGIEDVIKAIALAKDANISVKIIGFLFDEKYLKHLIKLARSLGVEKRVEVILNATRKMILESFAKAKVVIHPARYEPFGIAVVEGMAARCIPIVRKGLNGPWMEITYEGKYGLGFNSIDELSDMLVRAVRYYDDFNINAIVSRAFEFDEVAFREKFLKNFKEASN